MIFITIWNFSDLANSVEAVIYLIYQVIICSLNVFLNGKSKNGSLPLAKPKITLYEESRVKLTKA